MKKLIVYLLIGSIVITSCRKSDLMVPVSNTKTCESQTANPTGKSYPADSVISYICLETHCGIMPLSSKNYWVYEDSFFTNGVFSNVQFDTLRYLKTKKSLSDGLVWWEGNISVGLPDFLYANDSSIFDLSERLFIPGVLDVKKEFGLFAGDSIKYLTSFEDAAAMGRSLKIESPVQTPAGVFSECIFFEKNSRNYRKDQVYFKPGLGVIKYIQEKAPIGQRVIKLQQISTLVSVHIE